MRSYECSRAAIVALAGPVVELRPAGFDLYVREIGVTIESTPTAPAPVYGVGIAAQGTGGAVGSGNGQPLIEDDPASPTILIGPVWLVNPGVPAVYYRIQAITTLSRSGLIWAFRTPLRVPRTLSLVVQCIAVSGAVGDDTVSVCVAWDE